MFKLTSKIRQSGKFPVTSLLKFFIKGRVKEKIDSCI